MPTVAHHHRVQGSCLASLQYQLLECLQSSLLAPQELSRGAHFCSDAHVAHELLVFLVEHIYVYTLCSETMMGPILAGWLEVTCSYKKVFATEDCKPAYVSPLVRCLLC